MEININDKIYHIIKKDESLKDILFELGFVEILKPGRLQSVGRFVSLKDGAKMRDIDINIVIDKLKEKGYVIIDE